MKADQKKHFALAIITFAVVVRLVWAYFIPVIPVSDSHAYHVFATNIAVHNTYGWTADTPSAYWAVGTPAIYGAVYKVFGVDPSWAVAINLIATLVSLITICKLADRWCHGTGLVAMSLFTFWPLSITFTTVINSEMIFIALMLTSILMYVLARDQLSSGRTLRWLIMVLFAGALFAASTLVRPIALLIPFVLFLSEVVELSSNRMIFMRSLTHVFFVTTIMAICVSPWTIRNYNVFDEFVPVSTNFGPNFWMGNNPETEGGYQPLPEKVRGLNEVERSRVLQKDALDYIKSEPFSFITRTAKKALLLHDRETIGIVWNQEAILKLLPSEHVLNVLKVTSTLYWYLILGGAVAYVLLRFMATLRTQNKLLDVLDFVTFEPVLLWAYLVGVHAVIVVGDRYHLPLVPFVMILAAALLQGIWTRHMAKRDRESFSSG